MTTPTDAITDTDSWPTNLATEACLWVVVEDLANCLTEDCSPSFAAMMSLKGPTTRDGIDCYPGTEAGFRGWLNYHGGLSSEAIDAAVEKLIAEETSEVTSTNPAEQDREDAADAAIDAIDLRQERVEFESNQDHE